MKIEMMHKEMGLILDKKNADYTDGTDRHQNFHRAQQIVEWFKQDKDKVYATLFGIKLARLAALLSENKEPNNESIADTFIDLANYALLWGSDRTISPKE